MVLAGDTALVILIWLVLKAIKKQWTLYVPVIYMLIHAVDLNLVYRDLVYPPSLIIKNKEIYNDQFVYYLLIANIGNFMDIKLTFFLFIPVFICG